jgi:hypothetical protein
MHVDVIRTARRRVGVLAAVQGKASVARGPFLSRRGVSEPSTRRALPSSAKTLAQLRVCSIELRDPRQRPENAYGRARTAATTFAMASRTTSGRSSMT